MNMLFAQTLKKLRQEHDLSQNELAELMFVTRSTVTRWESGARLPDTMMIVRIAGVLKTDAGVLLRAAALSDDTPNVIIVDDSKVVLKEGLRVLEEVMPVASVAGFLRSDEAVEFVKGNRVVLAFLDIELGRESGMELCRRLLEIDPGIHIVFLTAYPDYSLEAWGTGAVGFMLKPLTAEGVREQLEKLRYPIQTGGDEA